MASYARFNGVVQDENGKPVQGASIVVIREGVGLESPIYSDRTGLTTTANPLTSAADGSYFFHAPGGAFRLEVTSPSGVKTLRYVALGLGAESDLPGLNPRGAYSAVIAYDKGDLVRSGGYLFASRTDANLNHTPDSTTPADTTDWMFIGATVSYIEQPANKVLAVSLILN